jgi:hypothetical protein
MQSVTRKELQALIDRLVDELPDPSEEQCRKVAAVLHASGALH